MSETRKRVAMYIRVSIDEQSRDGYDVKSQVRNLRNYIAMKEGWIEGWEYSDDGYDCDEKRPAYERLWDEIDEWDVLLIWKLDRIHNDMPGLLNMGIKLADNDKDLASVSELIDTTSDMGRHLYHIFGALIQFENKNPRSVSLPHPTFIDDGVVADSQEVEVPTPETGTPVATLTGKWITSPPFGYDIDKEPESKGHLVVNEEESNVVRYIFYLRFKLENPDLFKPYQWDSKRAGLNVPYYRTYQDIADLLHDKGIRTKKGKRWTPCAIRRVCVNPIYWGIFRYGSEEMLGGHEQLTPEPGTAAMGEWDWKPPDGEE